MSESDKIVVRIDPEIKSKVESTRTFPFTKRLPNQETLEAIRKADLGEELIPCEDAEDMFAKLHI